MYSPSTEGTGGRGYDPCRELAECSADVFWVRALDTGQLEYVNPAYEHVWGRSCQSLFDDPDSLLAAVHPADRQRVDLAFAQLPRIRCEVEFRLRQPDGTPRWVHCRLFSLTGGQRYAAIARDITERHYADEERTGVLEQLHQTQKQEAVGQVAGGIAHDFNNILTAILGTTELLKDFAGDVGSVRSGIDAIERSAQQAVAVTRGLLSFSRRRPVDRQRIDLGRAVSAASRLLRRMLPAEIELETELPRQPVWVRADVTQLQQVVLNLALNARDALPEGGRLRIAVAAAPEGADTNGGAGSAQLIVSDTGAGISPAERERIFEPFFTTKAAGQSTGLGLTITQRIVREHGGRIDVQSTVGSGSTFTVTLPCLAAGATAAPPRETVPAAAGERELVLIAEDDAPVRELMESTLAGRGFEVITVATGPDALKCQQIHGDRLRLLIFDVGLPQRSGLECLRVLRAAHVSTPAILTTGSLDLDPEGALGAETLLLRKPFSMAALGTLVAEVLSRPVAAPTG